MSFRLAFTAVICGLLLLATFGWAQSEPAQCPHKASDHDAMMQRGEKGMGFSQAATTHHFLLKPEGGVISVSANDAKDTDSRDHIRMHLRHIARAFSESDFDIPMFVHDQEPPGVPVMKRLAKEIRYEFRETDRGGEAAISSKSTEAVQAIHDFLAFQIR
ncbi:MAG TPA: hypothetical protein VK466_15365, partial [Terriglobales bacterium]|nr:hypothetical protein [Terriglobales bacterium]